MRILLGYLISFGWVFLMLLMTEPLKKKFHWPDEASRKIIHVSVGFDWIPMVIFFGTSWHLAVPTAAFIVLNYISYRQGTFSAMERSDESKKSLGTVYYAVSMTVMAIFSHFWPEALPAYGAGVFCMALGDGFAPYFGAIEKGNRTLFGNRTLYGSLSVFVICLLVLALLSAIFSLSLGPVKIVGIALGAVVFELLGVHGFDNLTLPLGVFLLVWLFSR